jgi:hypothetical protein
MTEETVVDPTTEAEESFFDVDSGIEFRKLSPEETIQFTDWATTNYKAGDPIPLTWHPVVRNACALITENANKPTRKAKAH